LRAAQIIEQATLAFQRVHKIERDKEIFEDLVYIFKSGGLDEQLAVAKAKWELERLFSHGEVNGEQH
jgi:K+-transporting ATPase c subunit